MGGGELLTDDNSFGVLDFSTEPARVLTEAISIAAPEGEEAPEEDPPAEAPVAVAVEGVDAALCGPMEIVMMAEDSAPIDSWAALQEAIGARTPEEPSTFTIAGGFAFEDEVIVPAGETWIFEGAGTLTAAAEKRHFTVNGTLVLAEGNGLTLTDGEAGKGGSVYLGSNAAFTMAGGTISGNLENYYDNVNYVAAGGGAVYVDGGAFTMTGGEISGNQSYGDGGGVYANGGTIAIGGGALISNNEVGGGYGGGVYANGGTIAIGGGALISNNEAGGGYGGGVAMLQGEMNMTGGEIRGNNAGNGGGVYVADSVFTMTGGEISGNISSYGGGVYIADSTFNMTDGEISGNGDEYSIPYGAGVFMEGGAFTMSGGLIGGEGKGNRSYQGGGVCLTEGAEFTMSGSAEISENVAGHAGGGGGIAASGFSKVNINGGVISGNIVQMYGGGVFIDSGSVFTMTDGVISGNEAAWVGIGIGAGVWLSGGEHSISGGRIIENISQASGGGIYMSNAVLNMTGGEISGNTTSGHGGGVQVNNASVFNMSGDAAITGNDAGAYGGGVYLSGGSNGVDEHGQIRFITDVFTMSGSATISNNSADIGGGGLYVEIGNVADLQAGTISGNSAGGTADDGSAGGGGIYVSGYMYSPAYSVLSISGSVKFFGNSASEAHDYGIENRGEAGDYPNIDWAGDNSVYGAHLLNNYDVNYSLGTPPEPPKPDWVRLRQIIETTEADTVTIYPKSSEETEDLPNGILVLLENEDFINSDGKAIKVSRDVTLQSSDEASITLNTTKATDRRHFTQTAGSFTLTNITLDGNTLAGGIDASGSANLTLDAGAVIQNCTTIKAPRGSQNSAPPSSGGGVAFTSTGAMAIKPGAALKGNRAIAGTLGDGGGGAVSVSVGSLTMSGGEISGNFVGSYLDPSIGGGWGGGVYVGTGGSSSSASNATFTLTGGTFSNNEAGSGGGGVAMWNGALTMDNGSISDNITDGDGGGVNVSQFAKGFIMNGGTITGNEATGDKGAGWGGGVRVTTTGYFDGGILQDYSFIMNGGTISGNTAHTKGGGVYASINTHLQGGEISGNTVGSGTTPNGGYADGGGIYMARGALAISSGTISGNTVNGLPVGNGGELDGRGGGVFMHSESDGFSMTGGLISGNTVKDSSGIGSFGGGLGGGLYYDGRSSAAISGGAAITGNTAGTGGGVYVNKGALTVGGGAIAGNRAVGYGSAGNMANAYGGGVYLSQSAAGFTMTGGLIGGEGKGNTAGNDGGGVYVNNKDFTMEGDAEIAENEANFAGGVAIVGGGVFTMRGNAAITGNKAAEDGGGAVINESAFTMAGNASISGNMAEDQGGGVCIYSGGSFTMSGDALISGNEAANDGGGVTVNGSTFTMEDGEISANVAGGYAGGLGLYDNSTVELEGGVISGNTAAGAGGVGVMPSCELLMTGGSITQNEAELGAGVGMLGGMFSMTAGTISGNAATANGGGVYVVAGDFTMNEEAAVSGNTAAANGGGVYMAGGRFIMQGGGGVISGNTATNGNGGGIFTENFSFLNFIAEGAAFSGNTARSAYWLEDYEDGMAYNPGAGNITVGALKALHGPAAAIKAPAPYSNAPEANKTPFTYLVNNYDVNFVPPGWTVTFDYNGADNTPAITLTQDVIHGEKAIAPTGAGVPVKDGFIFLGWHKGADKWNFNTPVTENMTLTALWRNAEDKGLAEKTISGAPKAYAVGDAVEYKLSYTLPQSLAGITQLIITDIFAPADALNYVGASVSIDGAAAMPAIAPTVNPGTGAQAWAIPLAALAGKEGKDIVITLNATVAKADVQITNTMKVSLGEGIGSPDDDVTKLYKVSYDTAGGAPDVSDEKLYAPGATVTVSDAAVKKSGSAFLGWKRADSGNTYRASDTFTMPNMNVSLTAQWQASAAPSYTVQFLRGLHGIFTEQSTQGLKAGDRTPAPPEPIGERGWQFERWEPAVRETVNGNATYTAIWTAAPSYTVTYAPGLRGAFTAVSTPGLLAGDPTPTPPATPGQEGWRFTGWTPAPSATVNGSATYTAQWAEDDDSDSDSDLYYTVRFVDWDGRLLKSQQVESGGDATPPASPTRGGYSFLRWDGAYTNVTRDVTVRAVYVIDSATTVNSTGGDSSAPGAGGDSDSSPNSEPDSGRRIVTQDSPPEDVLTELREAHNVPSFTLGDTEIPLSAGPLSHLVWALLNLILALTGIVLAIVAVIRETVSDTKQTLQRAAAANPAKAPCRRKKRGSGTNTASHGWPSRLFWLCSASFSSSSPKTSAA